MKRRQVEIWRRRNEKLGEEKEKKERETGWSEKKEREEKKREKKKFKRGEEREIYKIMDLDLLNFLGYTINRFS